MGQTVDLLADGGGFGVECSGAMLVASFLEQHGNVPDAVGHRGVSPTVHSLRHPKCFVVVLQCQWNLALVLEERGNLIDAQKDVMMVCPEDLSLDLQRLLLVLQRFLEVPLSLVGLKEGTSEGILRMPLT